MNEQFVLKLDVLIATSLKLHPAGEEILELPGPLIQPP